MRNLILAAATLLLAACGTRSESPTVDAGVDKAVRAGMARLSPTSIIDDVKPAPFAGFQQVAVGAQVLYISNDGRHVIEGAVVDTQTHDNLTAPAVQGRVASLLKKLDINETVVFPAKAAKVGRVFVFTDPTCGYCQKLHHSLADISAAGVEVVYLGYPRAGLQSPQYAALTSMFCAEDKKRAAGEVFISGAPVQTKGNCLSPVDVHYQLGQRLGVSGTPAIFTEDGRQIGGYLTADQMVARLKDTAPPKAG